MYGIIRCQEDVRSLLASIVKRCIAGAREFPAMQMFNQNPDPDAVAKAKEALKVCLVSLCMLLPESSGCRTLILD